MVSKWCQTINKGFPDTLHEALESLYLCGFWSPGTCLQVLAHLKDIKFQIVGLIRRPQNRMVAGLRAEFHLAEPFMGASGGILYGFFEQIRIHKMRAGTGGEETAVFDKPHAPQVDLPVAFDGILDGIAGFCEGGGI